MWAESQNKWQSLIRVKVVLQSAPKSTTNASLVMIQQQVLFLEQPSTEFHHCWQDMAAANLVSSFCLIWATAQENFLILAPHLLLHFATTSCYYICYYNLPLHLLLHLLLQLLLHFATTFAITFCYYICYYNLLLHLLLHFATTFAIAVAITFCYYIC